jgi:hypothetical protein
MHGTYTEHCGYLDQPPNSITKQVFVYLPEYLHQRTRMYSAGGRIEFILMGDSGRCKWYFTGRYDFDVFEHGLNYGILREHRAKWFAAMILCAYDDEREYCMVDF